MPDDHLPHRALRRLLLVLLLGLPMGTAHSEVPRTIHYQGKLTKSDGSLLTGEHVVTLRLYDAAADGTELWKETHAVTLAADNSIFSVILGAAAPFGPGITFNDPLWLTIEVDGGGEFSPRQPLSAVGYAINADRLDGLDSAELIAASGAGDITAVTAGAGLTGGATSGDASLEVGAGAGLIVTADAISVDVGATAGKIVQLGAGGALPAVSGAALTSLSASALASGSVPDARLSAAVSLLGPSIDSAEVTDGTLTAADTATAFLTAGSGVTLTKGAASWDIAATGIGGTVTSVGLSAPAEFTVAGSPVTGSGTLTLTKAAQGANQLYAGPPSGAAAAPAFRALAAADFPADPYAATYVNEDQANAITSAMITDGTLAAADTADTFLTAGSGVALTKGAASWDISAVGSGGDITAVTAGAGLTGGGTSGDVTVDLGAGTGLLTSADAVAVDVGTTAGKIVQLGAGGALPAVSGANLTALNASSLASGTVPDARLSSHVSLLGESIGASELEADSVGASALAATAIQAGDIEVGDLPAHAGTHQPGGSDALPTAGAVSVASANSAGTSTSLSRADHGHQGLHSVKASGQSEIVGDATLAGGSNVTLTQSGSTITIAASGELSIDCLPIGGVDAVNRTGTFQIATFGSGATDGRPDHLWPAPVGGSISNFHVFVGTAPGSGDSWTATLRKNDANTSLSCVIAGTSAKTCTAGGGVSVTPGDRIGVQAVEGGSANGTNGAGWSACFVPD